MCGDSIIRQQIISKTGRAGATNTHTALSRLQIYETLLAQVNVHGPVEMQPIPCSIHDFNTLEKRPLDVSMKPDKLVETIGIKLKSVEEVCRDVVREALQHQECG